MAELIVGVITISDRAYHHEREDKSGPALIALCKNYGWIVARSVIINDETEFIKQTLLEFAQEPNINLILTTGGTGVSPRDNTPEATLSVINKQVPGISEYIRSRSYEKTSNSIFSRAVSGIINDKLIINLPGSPRGAIESLEFVHDAIPHAIELLQGYQPH